MAGAVVIADEAPRPGTNVSGGGTFFDILAADVTNGTLPQVSWVVAPELAGQLRRLVHVEGPRLPDVQP
jgi:phospholipase C